MSQMMTIARREMKSLFVSPIAYVVMFLFVLFMGIFFTLYVFKPGEVAELRFLFDISRFALFFIVPLMTMSMYSDEYRSGRIEMLRTSPLTELQLLLGKFFGAMGFYLVLLALTLVFLIYLMIFGHPDMGAVLASYVGMILMGMMFVSVGLFFSACTSEQIVAAMSGMITLAAFTALPGYLIDRVPSAIKVFAWQVPARDVLGYLMVSTHMGNFAKGTIVTADIAYFAVCSFLFLFFTYLLLESRKWR